MGPFPAIPAVVLAAGAPGRLEIDLLPVPLPDVGDVEVVRRTVEAEAPGVAQAEGPDLGGAGRGAGEGVARRDGVVAVRICGEAVAVDVDAQDLAQQGVLVLAALKRIAAA